jgi:hypothetical protein
VGRDAPTNPGCLLDELIARATIFPQATILVAGWSFLCPLSVHGPLLILDIPPIQDIKQLFAEF